MNRDVVWILFRVDYYYSYSLFGSIGFYVTLTSFSISNANDLYVWWFESLSIVLMDRVHFNVSSGCCECVCVLMCLVGLIWCVCVCVSLSKNVCKWLLQIDVNLQQDSLIRFYLCFFIDDFPMHRFRPRTTMISIWKWERSQNENHVKILSSGHLNKFKLLASSGNNHAIEIYFLYSDTETTEKLRFFDKWPNIWAHFILYHGKKKIHTQMILLNWNAHRKFAFYTLNRSIKVENIFRHFSMLRMAIEIGSGQMKVIHVKQMINNER